MHGPIPPFPISERLVDLSDQIAFSCLQLWVPHCAGKPRRSVSSRQISKLAHFLIPRLYPSRSLEGRLQLVEARMLGKSDGGSAFSSTRRDRQSEARRDPLIELLTFFFSPCCYDQRRLSKRSGLNRSRSIPIANDCVANWHRVASASSRRLPRLTRPRIHHSNPIPITDRPTGNRRNPLPRHQNPHKIQRIRCRQRHRLSAQG